MGKEEQLNAWKLGGETSEFCILLLHNIAFFPSGNAIAEQVGLALPVTVIAPSSY